MSIWDGAVIAARIWHGRSGDAVLRGGRRDFTYHAHYIAVDIDQIDAGTAPIAVDRPGFWRLRRHDYGPLDGSSLRTWAEGLLGMAGLQIVLVTLPRSAFWGFNPVSFWLARDTRGLRAVIAEVSSTFGERHCYLIRHPDGAPIEAGDRISGEKLFHVSPFLPREGSYTFRFDTTDGRFGAFVDWSNGSTRLGTSLAGHTRPLTSSTARRAAWRHPFQPERVISLIHWQAAQIIFRGLTYHAHPRQLARRTSTAEGHEHV
ncbi:DUF1365 domain-containing protein [Sinirhodobacter sp. WL0062]|uniref:DUF1365 domain-containing protein n=1 Tax=Rhodobacter flavimaris TaxID=2907145 RepID=A0ABS8YQ31_9RHOB|nr:DUF1365 domain-containing protein [Sinirhodobacter sp. WL0062]MCE5972012.1 DUF1365 domain-containing protein [Sinirhodobacter sp. WL0062]